MRGVRKVGYKASDKNMDRTLRVLLIDLGSTRKEINEPIGICAVASYVKKYVSYSIDIELKFLPLSKLPTQPELASFDVVGLSTKIGSLNKIHKINNDILELPLEFRPFLVFGDLIATFATKNILKIFNHAICVVGEGEVCFLKLLDAIQESIRLKIHLPEILLKREIPNLAFIAGNKYIQNKSKLVDLSTCPSPQRTFAKEVSAVGGIIRGEGSRGCAWGRCSFCAIQHKYCNETRWRPIAIERIIDELETFSSLGINSPFYTDEDFIGNDPIRAIELSQSILHAKKIGNIDNKLSLYVDMRVDSILSRSHNRNPSGKDVLISLKAAGLREVFIGIESGAKEQVKRYKKASTAQRNILVLDLLREVGVTFDIGFIMFDPEMSVNEILVNIEFLSNTGLNYHDARMTKSLRIEPGTPIVKEYIAKDMLVGDMDIDQLVYPYRWSNSDTQEAYERFSEWEQEYSDDVYTIQAATRGEIESELLRKEWRVGLGEIRAIEIQALNYIAMQLNKRSQISKYVLLEFQECRYNKILHMLEIIN